MGVSRIIAEIDEQIRKLQQARALLAGTDTAEPGASRRGRPRGATNKAELTANAPKRVLSPEGRARIAAAQKKRHAAKRRADKKAASEAAQE
jgi:hypothetical protein